VLLGKHAKLIASSLSTHPLLAQFLQSNDNQYLSWLHDIQLNNYRQVTLISTILTILFNKQALENLELSGNFTAVREMSGNGQKVWEVSGKHLVTETVYC